MWLVYVGIEPRTSRRPAQSSSASLLLIPRLSIVAVYVFLSLLNKYFRSVFLLFSKLISPLLVAWSVLCSFRCSVNCLILVLRCAIWYSEEPTSFS